MWDNCDPSVIHDLSIFNDNVFIELVQERGKPKPVHTVTSADEFPNGSRGLELNRCLCGQVVHCESLNDLLDIARDINDGFQSLGYGPLDDTEVVKRSKAVWGDWLQGKIELRHNRRARAFIPLDELDEILTSGNDSAAILLMKLRGEHAGRMERGETFAIAGSSMAMAQTLPGWGRDKIRSARDVLIKLGYLERVAKAYGNQRPAQYQLIDQTVGPSLARRREQK
jgi:hypothetical protein